MTVPATKKFTTVDAAFGRLDRLVGQLVRPTRSPAWSARTPGAAWLFASSSPAGVGAARRAAAPRPSRGRRRSGSRRRSRRRPVSAAPAAAAMTRGILRPRRFTIGVSSAVRTTAATVQTIGVRAADEDVAQEERDRHGDEHRAERRGQHGEADRVLVRLRIGHEPYVNDVPDADEGPPNPLDDTPSELLADGPPAPRRRSVPSSSTCGRSSASPSRCSSPSPSSPSSRARRPRSPASSSRCCSPSPSTRWWWPRSAGSASAGRSAVGLVGTLFALGVLIMVLVVGPAAVREARKFGDQLPQTVEQLYDIPIVGHRLREADAAGQVTKWLEDLPARVDTSDIVSAGRDARRAGRRPRSPSWSSCWPSCWTVRCW